MDFDHELVTLDLGRSRTTRSLIPESLDRGILAVKLDSVISGYAIGR